MRDYFEPEQAQTRSWWLITSREVMNSSVNKAA